MVAWALVIADCHGPSAEQFRHARGRRAPGPPVSARPDPL